MSFTILAMVGSFDVFVGDTGSGGGVDLEDEAAAVARHLDKVGALQQFGPLLNNPFTAIGKKTHSQPDRVWSREYTDSA